MSTSGADPFPIEIDCRTAQQRLAAGGAVVLLDCREQDEYATVHIAGSVLLPMSELMQRAGELEAYREGNVIVHCHHGGRSLRVTHWLRKQGFARAQNMAGGIDQWAVEIEPGMVRY
jgi:rhodanese-related sulfurtransferase